MRPTQAHFLRMTAAEESAADVPMEALEGYDLMLSTLAMHKRRLKQIQSNEKKAEYKLKNALPDFLPWIQGVLKAGSGKQDDILMTWLVWAIDCEEYQLALKISEYALKHDLALPENFNRTLATVIAEEFANKALFADSEALQAYLLPYLEKVRSLTDEEDMPDQSRAKLYKMIGLFSENHAPETALNTLIRANQLNPYIGVKTVIKRLKKKISSL
ncbi:phage terminase small subunit [Glaesserella parasuis]|uniref:phage terminase small subunit n=3 Tax=Glaesserella parasuis TaxID=738 RepID=UPI0003AC38D5|nr:phage terminase small subunit [Glaesserella parasuis]ATW43513.1 terminase [Glaesserella parasuis D74]ATW43885.1 terminase [Glaesserella parasuis D74]EQA10451.1 phage small terminase subunit [Glaesserella parasuis D74]MCT8824433.1 terminase [Glaesserella parasuis]MDP0318733.1 phage terminase small subunit [Glaesserella parasuis]